jgi:hypothetical protein
MRSILVVPRVASGPRRGRLPCQGVTEISMSAGRKENPEKSVSPRQPKKNPDQPATAVHKSAASPTDSSTKSDKPEHKAAFAQGTYYRQGVLVPGGPHKSPMPRSRNR